MRYRERLPLVGLSYATKVNIVGSSVSLCPWFAMWFATHVYLIVYHIWFTPVISEDLPLKSRLVEEGEGLLLSGTEAQRSLIQTNDKKL